LAVIVCLYSGSLLVISVPDFYRHAMSIDVNAPVPNVSGKYNQWTHLPRTENQLVMELYRWIIV